MLLFGVCPTPSHLLTRLNNLPSLSLFSQGGHLQNMFQFISFFLALAHLKLGAVFEVQSDESWVEGENSFPQPNRYTPINTLHGMVGLLGYQSMLLTLVLLATTMTPIPAKVRPSQNFTSLYSCKFFSFLVSGLVESHEVPPNPSLHPVKVFLNGSPAREHVKDAGVCYPSQVQRPRISS